MDECMLNDLLECSVCLERLDTSSKVLPCQHTFCKRCLEEIVSTHKELRCPECRVLVDIKIDDLPPNVLLMRILEGMRNAAPKKQVENQPQPQRSLQLVRNNTNVVSQTQPGDSVRSAVAPNKMPHMQVLPPQPHQPYGRALYDYVSTESDDLSFKKGDVILLRKRMDMHWYLGECNGKHGLFPSAFVQVIIPLPCHIPQCKALYDFRMSGEEEEGCLAFSKGAVINVIRRVDENWAEGRLNDRVGIFPLAFVELNGLARSLMKLSTNSQPGPSRVAPPTPTSEESTTPLISTDLIAPSAQPANQQPPPPRLGSDSSSTISSTSPSTTPNTSSSNTSSSSSSTAPSSPTSPPPPTTRSITSTVQSPPPRPSATAAPAVTQREKRHSFSAINSGHHHQSSHRHSAEILSSDHPEHPPAAQNGSVLPSAYIALYSYTPQKSDELELRKGGIYMVTERCQDGWFKGTSNRTQKCGVFPGNYVAPARGIPRGSSASLPQVAATPRVVTSSGAPPLEPRIAVTYTRNSKPSANSLAIRTTSANNRQPPELPPRSVSPAVPTSTVSCSWHGLPDAGSPAAPLGRSQSAVMSSTTSSPNFTNSSSNSPKTAEKAKDRKEKGTVSLMRRLTSMKRSKSPPPTTYSMDNPVFEDSQAPVGHAVLNQSATGGQSSPAHPVHVRSGSCPSQLLQAMPSSADAPGTHGTQGSHHRFLLSGSQRIKHKERGHVVQMSNSTSTSSSASHPQSSSSSRHGGEGSGGVMSNTSSAQTNHHHRKSNSLDAGTKTTTSAGAKVSAHPHQQCSSAQPRERYRCIVPYPPNSEYELELRLNDIIYVHKKRDDGWYKGIQQRTGRTGLFPASFVESF